MAKLKPCPFCGYPARIFVHASGGCSVRCVNDDCDVQTPIHHDFHGGSWNDTRTQTAVDIVIEIWNRRADNG